MLDSHKTYKLVIRELMQESDGRIGTRFMPELMPATGKARKLASVGRHGQTLSLPATSGMLTFDVVCATDGRLDLTFLPAEGERDAFTWSLDLGEQRAQFAPSPTARQKTLREGGKPQAAVDYAIDHLDVPHAEGRTFPVRIILRSDPKFDGTVADVEIAGRRTMITYRHHLSPRRVKVGAVGVKTSNYLFSEFKE